MTAPDTRDGVRQEEDTLAGGRILVVVGATVLVSLLLALWAGGVVLAGYRELRPSGDFEERRLGAPRELEAIEQQFYGHPGQGEAQHAGDRRALSSFAWVDRERGIVRIPVERAMELFVEEARRGEGARP